MSLTPEQMRIYCLWKKHRMTAEEYDEMLKSQGGVCALCGGKQKFGKTKALAVDHDHQTNRIRGLLCGPCNTALGRLGDTPEAIRKVLAYVEKGEGTHVRRRNRRSPSPDHYR